MFGPTLDRRAQLKEHVQLLPLDKWGRPLFEFKLIHHGLLYVAALPLCFNSIRDLQSNFPQRPPAPLLDNVIRGQ